MALTKEIIEDKIEVVGEYKYIQIRTCIIIKDDGNEISRSFSRNTLSPSTKNGSAWEDTDISSQSAEVQAICNAAWTSSVKTAYQNYMDDITTE
jgi:hypothetical protein|tara:strand:- start:48 stop:329 length:282 start_codon:yes stop_codon:yes gene_type:complete